jgi:hypothetical protein
MDEFKIMNEDLINIWKKLRMDPRMDRLYDRFAYEAARIISMMRKLDRRKLKNHPLYNQLKRLSEQFAVDLQALIMDFISEAY